MKFARIVYLGLGLGVLLWVLQNADWNDIFSLVADAGVVGILSVVAVYAVGFYWDAVSWSLIITSVPINMTWFRRAFFIRMAGEAFNNVVPAGGFAGEPLKAVILKRRYGVSYSEATASIVMARTINMIAMIAFLVIGFAMMLLNDNIDGPLKWTASAGVIGLTFGTICLFAIQRFKVSSWIMTRFRGDRWASKLASGLVVVEELDQRFVHFYTQHGARLLVAFSLAFITWIVGVVEIYLIFYFLGHPITWSEAWMIEAITQMVRTAVFFIPLAIGAQEGALLVISTALTGVPALGLACAAVRRCRELIWVVFGFIAAFSYPTSLKEAGLITDDKRGD